jgi:hypothetical protein
VRLLMPSRSRFRLSPDRLAVSVKSHATFLSVASVVKTDEGPPDTRRPLAKALTVKATA